MQETYIAHVGKEANKLEKVEAGLEYDPEVIYTEYLHPDRNERRLMVLPVLREMPIDRLIVATGMHHRSLFAIRAGERLPHSNNRQQLIAAAGAYARGQLLGAGVEPTSDDIATCAAYLSAYANVPW